MARHIEETWHAVGFGVVVEDVQLADSNGQPIHDALGRPKTKKLTTIILRPEPNQIVKIPLDDEPRQKLIQQLVGGIFVPTVNGGA